MDYSTLEIAIVTALESLNVPGTMDVMAWPESELEFSRPFTVSRVSVVYHSSEFKPTISANESIQEETVALQLMIESRNLRGTGGIYQIKDQVLDLIQGLIIPNWTRLSAGKFEMAERDPKAGTTFRYNLIMKTAGIRQQVINDYDVTLGTLAEITNSVTYGTSV